MLGLRVLIFEGCLAFNKGLKSFMKTVCWHLACPLQHQSSHQVYYLAADQYSLQFVLQMLSNVNLISDFYFDHRLTSCEETPLSRNSEILHINLVFTFLVLLLNANTKGALGATSLV